MSYTIPEPTKYPRKDVAIPDDFLTFPPPEPLAATPVPFTAAGLPEYDNRLALTIDNVLTPSECGQLQTLVESSVPDIPEGESPWKPASLRLTPGVEVPSKPGYRQSDRIVWCNQIITNRIWERCASAEGLREKLAVVKQQYGKVREGEWQFRRMNDRMSFLRYEKGQYFKRSSAIPRRNSQSNQEQHIATVRISTRQKIPSFKRTTRSSCTSMVRKTHLMRTRDL